MDMKKKLGEVYSKLSLVDKMLLNNYINKESERVIKEIAEEVDYCISAALVEGFENLSIKEIQDILDKAIEYRADQHDKAIELKKKYGKGLNEMVDKVSEQLTVRINKMLKEGTSQNIAIKMLKAEFKGIPNATIINTYKNLKEEYKANEPVKVEEVDELEEAAKYIVENTSNEPVKGTKIDKNGIGIANGVLKVTTVEKEIPKFKVLNRKIELKGAHDVYIVENETLVVGEYEFASAKDIEVIYKNQIAELELKIQTINNKMSEAIEVYSSFIK